MRKRRVYLILGVVGLVLAGVLVAVLSREREPEYGGKRLSEWVRELPAYGFLVDDAPSQVAIRHIGTNALPYLLKWLYYEQPPWKTKLYALVNPMLGRLKPSSQLNDQKLERAGDAALALMALGPGAEPAIPELTISLKNTKTLNTSKYAVLILAGLGDPGLPPLMSVFTNKQTSVLLRSCIVSALVVQGTNNGPAVRAMCGLLTNADEFSRRIATNALRDIDPLVLERATPLNAQATGLFDSGGCGRRDGWGVGGGLQAGAGAGIWGEEVE